MDPALHYSRAKQAFGLKAKAREDSAGCGVSNHVVGLDTVPAYARPAARRDAAGAYVPLEEQGATNRLRDMFHREQRHIVHDGDQPVGVGIAERSEACGVYHTKDRRGRSDSDVKREDDGSAERRRAAQSADCR